MIFLLLVDSVLLAIAEVMFLQLYLGPVPVPLASLIAAVTLPWLISQAGRYGGTPAYAALPLVMWLLTIAVLGFSGPGDDVLLPMSWPLVVPSALLLVGGLVPGIYALARVSRQLAVAPADARPPGPGARSGAEPDGDQSDPGAR